MYIFKSHPTEENPLVFTTSVPCHIKNSFYLNGDYSASRVSFDLPRQVGKRKVDSASRLDISCWAFAKNSNLFGSQSRVTYNCKTTKPKQTVGIFSKNSGKHTTTKALKQFKFLDFHFSFYWKKIKKFLNSGKQVSVTDLCRKYSWEFRQIKIVTLL